MKTILVLAQHPETAESIRAGLDVERYRVIHRRDVEEAEPFLRQAFLDVCIVDVELRDVQGIWVIERLKRRLPTCPVLVYTGNKQWEWEIPANADVPDVTPAIDLTTKYQPESGPMPVPGAGDSPA